MNDLCKNCSKQYFCKMRDARLKLNPIGCKDFISWIYTKNYGEVQKIENTETNKKK